MLKIKRIFMFYEYKWFFIKVLRYIRIVVFCLDMYDIDYYLNEIKLFELN